MPSTTVHMPANIVAAADPHKLALSVRASCLVFEDAASKALLDRVQLIAPSEATVLIIGETGTDQVRSLLKAKNVPKVSDMFQEATSIGDFTLVACSVGLEYTGVDAEAVTKHVDEVMGLPAILTVTAGAETTLFI